MATTLGANSINQNPFWILGATTRDDRQRIVQRADQKALELDHDLVQKARADLTNPRTRLAAELAWLPGVSPKKAEQLMNRLHLEPLSLRFESGLPALAHANLITAAFEGIDKPITTEEVVALVGQIASLTNQLMVDELRRDINEDRTVSGFPEIRSLEQIESELANRKRQIRQALKDGLNRLPTESLVSSMTLLVDRETSRGETHSPELIDELVDSYEVEAHEFLERESQNVSKLIEAARAAATQKHRALQKLIERIEQVARNWDRVAQPIQVSAKSRGTDHEPSNRLAFQIRSLAIELVNDHDLVAESKRLTTLLQDVFAEVPQLAERVGQDADALESIVENRQEWVREITYQAEVGIVFKDTLSISPDGISWKGKTYPLAQITRVRWGGLSHSVNGIPTGTTYTLAFGDQHSEAVVELRRKEVYSAFLDKLWRAVCARLLTELVASLKDGRRINFGTAQVTDLYVVLPKQKWIGANELVQLNWHETHIWNADGSFVIGSQKDKKVFAALSYIHTPNAHILEQVIRVAFKRGVQRLSQILEDE